MDTKHLLVLIMMLATLVVLIAGLGVMLIGGKTNAKYGNKLMVARVSLQGLTLLLIAILVFMGK